MQTFLPYKSFKDSARVLDYRRLGKQRVECLQILNALHYPEYGWQNHPAVKMWRGFEPQLIAYGLAICMSWISRGYKDTCLQKINDHCQFYAMDKATETVPWLTDELCASHRSNLIRKDPKWYRNTWPDVPDNLPYVWPV